MGEQRGEMWKTTTNGARQVTNKIQKEAEKSTQGRWIVPADVVIFGRSWRRTDGKGGRRGRRRGRKSLWRWQDLIVRYAGKRTGDTKGQREEEKADVLPRTCKGVHREDPAAEVNPGRLDGSAGLAGGAVSQTDVFCLVTKSFGASLPDAVYV